MAVQVHAPLRDPTEGEVRHQQRRVAAGVEHAVDLVEARNADPRDAEFMVSEHQNLAPPGRGHHPLAALPPQPGEHDVPEEVVELERRLAEFRVSSGACVGRRAEGSGERGPRVAEVAVDAGGGLWAELVWERALATWGLLMGLGKIYEEICREWFLPTYLGVMTGSSVEGTEDESVADRILRQARSGAVDEERLLPAREVREGRLGRELEKLMGESGWYKLVASRAHAIGTGEVAARREAEVAVVREVTGWRCEVERFAPGRLEEFDAGIRRALEGAGTSSGG